MASVAVEGRAAPYQPPGQAGDMSPDVTWQHTWPGSSPGSRQQWSWHPSSWGFNKDSQGHSGDQMPLEISPWCFARILVAGKELSKADLSSLQQGSVLLPVQAWHSARAAPVVPAAVRWGRQNYRDSTSQVTQSTQNLSMLRSDFHTCPGVQVAYWAFSADASSGHASITGFSPREPLERAHSQHVPRAGVCEWTC